MPHNTGATPIFQIIETIFSRLADAGWASFFLRFGIDITKHGNALAKELTRPLDLAVLAGLSAQPGFEDVAPTIRAAIERGDPAKSLLYHILASPGVIPFEDKRVYPTLADIEAVENYIYVATPFDQIDVRGPVSPPSLNDLTAKGVQLSNQSSALAIVVFAQEYRRGDESVHRKHADMCFARTGVARVGTSNFEYNPRTRGFMPSSDSSNINVLPSRYAAYLAVLISPTTPNTFGPLGMGESTEADGDGRNQFWVPIHKLFSGNQCIEGATLNVAYQANHVNEKIRRFHEFLAENNIDAGFITDARNHQLARPPFMLTAGLADLSIDPNMSNGLLVPASQPLARISDTSFVVPQKVNNANLRIDLFASSLEVRKAGRTGVRPAPEYLHIRSDERDGNLNNNPNLEENADAILLRRGRRAFHYTDGTADGWVTTTVNGLSALQVFPAYSLVTAPDFYPNVTQYDLSLWTNSHPSRGQEFVWDTPPQEPIYQQGGPDPLSQIRFAPNLRLRQATGGLVFQNTEGRSTVTALVTLPGNRGGLVDSRNQAPMFNIDRLREDNRHLSLPDASAGVFAPGWDVTFDHNEGQNHFAAYGLGSPFPEDAKLCAALSTFWPAAAPDATRTFLNDDTRINHTVVPMTNREIGGGLPGDNFQNARPWDGANGPRLSTTNILTYPRLFFTDYTLNAEAGRFTESETAGLTTQEYIFRMKVMHSARGFIAANPEVVGGTINKEFKLISVEKDDNHYYLHFGTLSKPIPQPGVGNHRFFQANVSKPFTLIVSNDLNVSHRVGIQRPGPTVTATTTSTATAAAASTSAAIDSRPRPGRGAH